MTGDLVYLIASLPMLLFGMKPPFSTEHFLGMAASHISSDDILLLKTAVLPESEGITAGRLREIIMRIWCNH